MTEATWTEEWPTQDAWYLCLRPTHDDPRPAQIRWAGPTSLPFRFATCDGEILLQSSGERILWGPRIDVPALPCEPRSEQ